MLRVGFLPSDFNPMMLMLGEADDLRLLAGVLRRFSRERADVRLDELGFCAVPGAPLTVTASNGAPGIQPIADDVSSGASTRLRPAHSPIRSNNSRLRRAPPVRRSWSARPRRRSR